MCRKEGKRKRERERRKERTESPVPKQLGEEIGPQ
jgi:hypothetical protein